MHHGKVIFYNLGNFALKVHFMTQELASLPRVKEQNRALDPDWQPPYPDYPSYPFPPDSRKTAATKCLVSHGSISRVSFLSATINQQRHPEMIPPTDERFQQVIDYITSIIREVDFHPQLKIEGEEVSVLV